MKSIKYVYILVTILSLTGCADYSSMEDSDHDAAPSRVTKVSINETEYQANKIYLMSLNEKSMEKIEPKSQTYEFHRRADFSSKVKGIYISQSTLEDRQYLEYLIKRSKEVGINTFIIDMNGMSNAYEKNILLVKNAGIRYVARVVVFPYGGNHQNMHSETYWMSRYRLVDAAIKLGADEIQLDYIRYAASNYPSAQNAKDVHNVISWFKDKIDNRAKLQIDVFGESSFKESPRIGQNIPVFAPSIDAVCPMLYPSHFEPYKEHAKRPYNIIYAALTKLKSQFPNQQTPFKLYAYVELSNYRHSFSDEQLIGYIHAQIKAVEDANADGWYVWSAKNKYDRLFNIMADA